MSEMKEISEINGTSPAVGICKFCRLSVHEEYLQSEYCQNCHRLSILYQINRRMSPFIMVGVLLSIFFIFTPYRSIALWIAIFAIAPSFIVNSFEKEVIFFGVPHEYRIIPILRYSKKLNNAPYIDHALGLMETYYTNSPEPLQKGMINEVVNSIILGIKPNPPGLFSKLAKITDLPESDLISYLMTETKMKDAFKQVPGTGTIPDIWEYANDGVKTEILDILSADLNLDPYAAEEEKKLLMEDLFLIDEELIEFIGENKAWGIILEELENFEPEEPPKNVFQEARRTAEAQQKLQQLSG